MCTACIRRIDGRLWRRTHWLAIPAYLLALAHGVALGTDTRSPWVQARRGRLPLVGLQVGKLVLDPVTPCWRRFSATPARCCPGSGWRRPGPSPGRQRTDEQEAREVTVLVDLHTGLPLDQLLPAQGSVLWGGEPDLVLPTRPLQSPWQAYAAARAHLEAAVLPPLLADYTRRLRPHLDRELRRVEEYFADLRQKYASRARTRLLVVTWYRWPRLEVTLAVDRRTRQDTLQVAYDPLARQVQPLPCARCRRWLRTLDEAARPVCPGGCPG